MTANTAQRVDKWLWFARVVKTRVLAAGLVEAGRVRINRHKVSKPGYAVGPGDVLTVALHGRIRVLKVLACADRRGAASFARVLYEEQDMSNSDGAEPQKEDARKPGTC